MMIPATKNSIKIYYESGAHRLYGGCLVIYIVYNKLPVKKYEFLLSQDYKGCVTELQEFGPCKQKSPKRGGHIVIVPTTNKYSLHNSKVLQFIFSKLHFSAHA